MLDSRGTGGSALEAGGTSCPARELERHEDLVVRCWLARPHLAGPFFSADSCHQKTKVSL